MVEHNQSQYYGNQYKFNGKELDVATGMYYYGARYYDPRLSIFISVDPLAEQFVGWTPYHYVHQNPINLIDPTGMSADGWIEQNEDGKTTVTFDPKVNTTEEAVAVGYKNVLQVLPSGSLLGQYNLNSDGSVCGEDVDWRRSQSYSGMSYFWVDENTEVRTYNSDAWNSESAQYDAWQRRSSGAITPIGGPFDVTGAGEVFGGFLAEYFSNPITSFAANTMFSKGKSTLNSIKSGENLPKGFKLAKEFGKSHGQDVYKKGNYYYSRDVDSHNGGVWKVFEKNGKRLKRIGTADEDLNIFKK